MIAVGDRVRLGSGFRRRVGDVLEIDGERVTIQHDDGTRRTVSRSACWPIAQTSHRNVLTAVPDYELRTAPAQPKPVAWRSAKYAAFVRAHPCCACGATEGIEAAHWGPDSGMSRRASDVYLNPLCASCHRSEGWHQHGTLPGRSRVQSEALLIQSQRDLLAEWFLRGDERG